MFFFAYNSVRYYIYYYTLKISYIAVLKRHITIIKETNFVMRLVFINSCRMKLNIPHIIIRNRFFVHLSILSYKVNMF